MTNDKAREFFSAYSEGSLESGLRLAFEQKLKADGALRSDFEQFESTLAMLATLHEEQIDIPFDLHEKVSARVDREIWEQKQGATPGFLARLRTLAFVGVAAIALVGGVYSLLHRGNGGNAVQSGIGPATSLELRVEGGENGPRVRYAPAAGKVVLLRSQSGGSVLASINVSKEQPLDRPVVNPNQTTVLLRFEVLDDPGAGAIELAVPGSRKDGAKTGSGTLEEFARALAGVYRETVALSDVDPLTQVQWDFKEGEARTAAQTALSERFVVDQTDGNVVTIRPS